MRTALSGSRVAQQCCSERVARRTSAGNAHNLFLNQVQAIARQFCSQLVTCQQETFAFPQAGTLADSHTAARSSNHAIKLDKNSTLLLFRNQLQAACPTDRHTCFRVAVPKRPREIIERSQVQEPERGDARRTQNTVPEHIRSAVLAWRACFLWRQVRRVSARMLLRRRRSAATAKTATYAHGGGRLLLPRRVMRAHPHSKALRWC